MNQITDYEIMAPVGSRDSLAAALKAGAGSVYFGVEQLNMRSHSANHFTIDDLREIAATCNEAGVKTYLTVNTIIYGEDIETMHQIVDAAVEAHRRHRLRHCRDDLLPQGGHGGTPLHAAEHLEH